MTIHKVVVDTDLILSHVMQEEGASLLRKAMNMFFCYTTVFNAIEAFSVAGSEKEIKAIDDAMSALKVLGLNGKSAKGIGKTISTLKTPSGDIYPVLMAGICIESKLPILTMNPGRFSRIKHIRLINARLLDRYSTPAEILSQ